LSIPATGEADAWRDAIALAVAAEAGDQEAIRVVLDHADLRAVAEVLASLVGMALRYSALGLNPGRFAESIRQALAAELGEAP
jgi:hypothetical protein